MTAIDDQGLAFAGVARLAQLVRDREVSPRELVALYLERIAQLDPALNAFRVANTIPVPTAAMMKRRCRHCMSRNAVISIGMRICSRSRPITPTVPS